MADFALRPKLPLEGARLPDGPEVSVTVWDAQIISVATARNAGAGRELPREGRSAPWGEAHILWSGVDRWVAVAEPGASLFAPLQAALGGGATLTDLSDGRLALRIEGIAAVDALARLVPIDLHRRAFPPGATAATLAGHIGIQLWRVPGDPACFVMLAPTSYAASLLHALQTACLSFTLPCRAP